jgi:type II secretory pathway pseudopilin PulG
MRPRLSRLASQSGITLVELLVSTSILAVVSGGMLLASISLQKSFRASRHYVTSQVEQVRLLDYMALDLRRALALSTANKVLSLDVPDFYESSGPNVGKPRQPTIKDGVVNYGAGVTPAPVRISYYQQGSSVYRNVAGKITELATDVKDFNIDYDDTGGQVIGIGISFIPRFHVNGSGDQFRAGTATYTTTLLRNKRRTFIPRPS